MRFLHRKFPVVFAFHLLNSPVNPVTFEPVHTSIGVRPRWPGCYLSTSAREHPSQRILFSHAIATHMPVAHEHRLQ